MHAVAGAGRRAAEGEAARRQGDTQDTASIREVGCKDGLCVICLV